MLPHERTAVARWIFRIDCDAQHLSAKDFIKNVGTVCAVGQTMLTRKWDRVSHNIRGLLRLVDSIRQIELGALPLHNNVIKQYPVIGMRP